MLQDLFLYLQSTKINQFCNYILLGDFNVDFSNQHSQLYSVVENIFDTFGLTQVVSEVTHTCSSGRASCVALLLCNSEAFTL